MPVNEQHSSTVILSQQLLLSVAEELKLPLTQIARQLELEGLTRAEGRSLQATAQTALQLIDHYILGVRLALEPQQFPLEAVSVSSVLYDTGQSLYNYAKNYDIDLELNIAGRFRPVMANQHGLHAALVSIGAALIEALPALPAQHQLKLQLATHRSRYGIVAGVYADTKQLSMSALRQGRRLQTHSRQPFLALNHSNGAGIFVADNILHAMDLHLVASRHHRLYGLGTVLQSNEQLQLV